ncbi:glycosyl transferase family 28 [Micromonospora arborensis]|uniref:Glycosyl transferase family 28 n=1 Tax=Micromonospora arborensis TaxID=2116518 RepID=A0A318NBT7_9ACTN|nr:activator-dependent family glycosyltransferase [Micromonospora arborensis]PYC63461.1 glycosyl transferase family 28 [Micromonospora arborensis]
MRVMFAVYAAKTHFYNMVPLAWALRAAGHDVVVATQPEIADAVTRTGLTVAAVGDEHEEVEPAEASARGDHVTSAGTWQSINAGMTETRPEALTWEYVLGAFTVGCSLHYEHLTGGRTMLDGLVEFARHWQPDLVVWDALSYAGPIAAEVTGAAHARMLFGLDYIGNMYQHYTGLLDAQPADRRDDPVTDWLTSRVTRYGAEFRPGSSRELMTGQWTIDPTPSWMRFPVELPYLPMRYVPYNGPTTVPGWINERDGRRRVCLTLGVTARENLGGDLFPIDEIVDAVAGLDVELIATLDAQQRQACGDLPANVRVVDFVPLNELLPTCDVIIHHGGFGTLGNAIVHGVRNLIVPGRYWDEIGFGELLESRSAGLYVDPYRLSGDALKSRLPVEELRDQVIRLLDDTAFAAGARTLRDEALATPSPHDIVGELERLTARHHRRQLAGTART